MTVQLIATKDKDWSTKFTNDINKSNPSIHAYIKKVVIEGTVWYTIRAGLFNSTQDAEKHGENLKKQFTEIKEYVVVPIK